MIVVMGMVGSTGLKFGPIGLVVRLYGLKPRHIRAGLGSHLSDLPITKKNRMIETHADALRRWAARYTGALVSQKSGRVSWLAMAGPNREWVNEGKITLRSNSVFALRPAMREIQGLHRWATARASK